MARCWNSFGFSRRYDTSGSNRIYDAIDTVATDVVLGFGRLETARDIVRLRDAEWALSRLNIEGRTKVAHYVATYQMKGRDQARRKKF